VWHGGRVGVTCIYSLMSDHAQERKLTNEQYEHCFGPIASEGYADITACNTTYQLKIHCL
jgi:hypothetical protein